MIGVSLPFAWLATGEGVLGDREAVFAALRARGVESVELRTVRADCDPAEVKRAADAVWDAGISITVHGQLKSAETAVQDVFAPLTDLLAGLRQDRLTVTVHPIVGDNVGAMKALSSHIEAHALPVRIALENNRLLPDKTEGDSTALVLETVKAVDSPHVGICFDMGHYMYYLGKNRPGEGILLPDKAFLKRVIHTHIHAMNGLKTHFPLDTHELPLDVLLPALAHEYFGVYNIELEFSRFEREPQEALYGSAQALREALPFCARLYDDIRLHFDEWFTSAASVLSTTGPGTRFGLLHSTSYLFNTNGFGWGMDVAIRKAPRVLAKTPAQTAALLQDLKLMIITHGHGDHFDKEVVTALVQGDTLWIVPDFLEQQALDWGIRPDKLLLARVGESLQVGPLTVTPFAGRHIRPYNGNGVPEYGYTVTAPDAPSLVFPADVRDYAPDGLPAPADYCFAHVWLSDSADDPEQVAAYVQPFADFALRLSDKNVLLTHLYEDGRQENSMWQESHATLIAEAITARSADTRVRIPKRGEVIHL